MGGPRCTPRSRRRGAPVPLLAIVCAALMLLPAAALATGSQAGAPPGSVSSCSAGAGCLPAGSAPTSEPARWRSIGCASPCPSPRSYAAMAYDPTASAVILFGGEGVSGEALGDTWEFAHGSWAPLPAASAAPSPRWGASMAYDGATGRLLLFGGENATSRFGDTWAFNGTAWHQFPTFSAPSPRYGAAMTYDPALQGVVLFGGTTAAPAPANDTWLLADGTWEDLAPQLRSSPGPLLGPELAFNANGSSLLLEGAPYPSTGSAAAFWELAGLGWAPLIQGAASTPAPRAEAAFVPDPAIGATVLFGGLLGAPGGETVPLGDTWTYSTGHWTNDTTALPASPRARFGAAVAYDPEAGGVLLFGGADGPAVEGDTWSFAPTPVQLTVTVSPTAGEAPLNVTFQASVHGGVPPYFANWTLGDGSSPLPTTNGSHDYTGVGTYLAELVVNDSAGGSATAAVTIQVLTPWEAAHQWGELAVPASRAPTPRWSTQVAYDPSIGAALLFGGELAGGVAAGDTWVFDDGVWINLTSGLAVSPPARWGGALAYDPGAGDLVLFGGSDGTQTFNDTWTYSPSVGWQETPTDTAPSPRLLSALVEDPGIGGDLLYGGGLRSSTGGWTIYNDTWEWKDGAWTNLTAPLIRGPPPTLGASAAYDSDDAQVLMFGGSALPPGGTPGTCYPDSELWIFADDQWSLSPVPDPPSQRLLSAAAYVPGDGSTILFGGAEARSGGCAAGGDTWSYDNATWSNLSGGIDVTPPARSAAAAIYDASDGELVLFGGDENGVPLNDTWVYPAVLNETSTTTTEQTVSQSSGSSSGSGGTGSGNLSGNGAGTFTVGYTISGAGGHVPDVVSLSATETGGTAPFAVSWYFGDSTPDGAGANISHTYTVPGTFEAVLTVVDASGQTVVELVGPIVVEPSLPGANGPAALTAPSGEVGWLFPGLGIAAVGVVVVAVLVELRQRRLREEGNALVREIEQSKNP